MKYTTVKPTLTRKDDSQSSREEQSNSEQSLRAHIIGRQASKKLTYCVSQQLTAGDKTCDVNIFCSHNICGLLGLLLSDTSFERQIIFLNRISSYKLCKFLLKIPLLGGNLFSLLVVEIRLCCKGVPFLGGK